MPAELGGPGGLWSVSRSGKDTLLGKGPQAHPGADGGTAVSPSEWGSHRDPESCKDKGIFFFSKTEVLLTKSSSAVTSGDSCPFSYPEVCRLVINRCSDVAAASRSPVGNLVGVCV